jgi:hypothetical protein
MLGEVQAQHSLKVYWWSPVARLGVVGFDDFA